MFINISNQLPKTSYIKMMDVWLIFNLILPFTEVLLHTYKVKSYTRIILNLIQFARQDYLRDEKREVNHHGRVRTLGEDGETDTENTDEMETQVLQNNWVGGTEQLKLDLVSRHEDVQVRMIISCLVIPRTQERVISTFTDSNKSSNT